MRRRPQKEGNMTQSEANKIYENVMSFSKQYEIIGAPEENQSSYFSWQGCSCCSPARNLGNDVYDIDCKETLSEEPKTEQICNECLCMIHNADFSCLDYHVTDKDCRPSYK